jgi:phosphoenolpyruvate carboxykinase (ATP)
VRKSLKSNVNVWLINTGWSGGSYGVGKRMSLKYTRAMITAALEGQLDNVAFTTQDIFGLQMPNTCPNVPEEILHPRNTWQDKSAYDDTANLLAGKFVANFTQYQSAANKEIMDAAPKASVTA